jgi:hypothetical protein
MFADVSGLRGGVGATLRHAWGILASAAAVGIVLALPLRAAAADEPVPTQPAAVEAAPASGGVPATAPVSLKIVVIEVHGLVQARASDNSPWRAAQVGLVLTEGASFRTGPRAWVTCEIPPDQTFRLDRLGVVKVDEAIRTGKKVKTDLIMDYGRTQYDIEAAGIEHESTIRSPSSTLAVRGTNVVLTDQPPFAPDATSYTGTALYTEAQRETKLGGQSYAYLNSDDGTAAQTALQQSVVDPSSAAARSQSEKSYIAQQVSRGVFFSFDEKAGIDVVSNGPGPESDAEIAANQPGELSIFLRWTGNAHLDLLADAEAGNPEQVLANFQPTEFLYPGFGLNVSASGGRIPYDDLGGPRGGQEVAFWGANYPQGVYGITANNVSGAAAQFEFNAFLNGKPLEMLAFQVDQNGNDIINSQTGFPTLIKNTTLSMPLGPGQTVSAIFFAPPFPAITNNFPTEPAEVNTSSSSPSAKPARVASNPSSDKIAAVRLLMASPGAANSFAEPVKMR